MIKKSLVTALFFVFLASPLVHAESVRVLVSGIHRVSPADQSGATVPLSYTGSSLIMLDGDPRFFRGLQLEITAPWNFISFGESMALAIYGELDRVPGIGVADLVTRRIGTSVLPSRIRTIYQIPLREDHGLRSSPYATVLTGQALDASSFPLLFRLMPVNSKGVPQELQNMTFNLTVRPIVGNEGSLQINFVYPENLPGKPFTVLINDEVIKNPHEERLLSEGEHHLVVLSSDYRNLSSRFVIERARALELTVQLQDTTPFLVFEHPLDARVYLNNVFLPNSRSPHPVEPGIHEVRFHVSDYTVVRTVTVQRGRTYRVALHVDIVISETD